MGVDQVDAGVEIVWMTSFSCVTTAGSSVKGFKARGKTREQKLSVITVFLKHYISHLCYEEYGWRWS